MIILGMGSTNESRRYITTQNDPCHNGQENFIEPTKENKILSILFPVDYDTIQDITHAKAKAIVRQCLIV